VIELDGWLALGAQLPPKEKRGLVLIDPPFEEEGEFSRLVDGLRKAHRRWPGGIYALWYPIKDRRAVTAFRAALKETAIPKLLDIAFEIRPASDESSLDGSGLVVVNPPYTLEGEFLEVDPPRKLVQTWSRLGMDGEPSVLTYLLEAIDGGTRLTVRHAGIVAPEQRQNMSAGWRTSCDRLSEILPTQKR